MARIKINSLYLYSKTQAEKNSVAFYQNLLSQREGLDKVEKAQLEEMSVIHRRMYLAGMYLEMISPELTAFLAHTLDEKRATVSNLIRAIEYLGIEGAENINVQPQTVINRAPQAITSDTVTVENTAPTEEATVQPVSEKARKASQIRKKGIF